MGGVAEIAHLLYCINMTYRTGAWGEKAKARSKTRTQYFVKYRREKALLKSRARNAVGKAIKKGLLKREPCRDFGEQCYGRIEAHHPDHSKQLEVIWLCSRHHRAEHRKIKDKL